MTRSCITVCLILLTACSKGSRQTNGNKNTQMTDSLAQLQDTDPAGNSSAGDTAATRRPFPSTWTSLAAIPHHWIKLERDSLGYLIYSPCDGGTPRIYIDSGYVKIYWQIGGPDRYSIDKFTRLKGNRSFYIGTLMDTQFVEFTAEIKDPKRKLVLWTFYDMKWVMTPVEDTTDFRLVDNPCPHQMLPEKKFLPVEF